MISHGSITPHCVHDERNNVQLLRQVEQTLSIDTHLLGLFLLQIPTVLKSHNRYSVLPGPRLISPFVTLVFSHVLRLMFILHSDPLHPVPSQLASPNQTL